MHEAEQSTAPQAQPAQHSPARNENRPNAAAMFDSASAGGDSGLYTLAVTSITPSGTGVTSPSIPETVSNVTANGRLSPGSSQIPVEKFLLLCCINVTILLDCHRLMLHTSRTISSFSTSSKLPILPTEASWRLGFGLERLYPSNSGR